MFNNFIFKKSKESHALIEIVNVWQFSLNIYHKISFIFLLEYILIKLIYQKVIIYYIIIIL